MREILSRGKRADNGEWAYGLYVLFGGKSIIMLSDTTEIRPSEIFGLNDLYENPVIHEVDPDTVSQFTGLLDKSGNEIFDGDIVRTKYGRLCEVVWFTSPEFNGLDLRPLESKHRAPDKFDLWSNLTVAGNKWDNPELLNQ